MKTEKRDIEYYLYELYKHMKYYNNMAPFPVYDREYIDKVKEKIESMKYTKEEYNAEPVSFCSHCKSLHIENDESNNGICQRCGSVNEIEILSIDKYNELYNDIWE